MPFLKIYTKGYEWKVLDVGIASLQKVKGVLIEFSDLLLYEGQHLWQEYVARLERAGFMLWSFEPVFVDPINCRTVQWNGVFFRQ